MTVQRPEQAIQKAVIAHLDTRRVPGVFYFHVPSGGYRRPIEAKIFKSIGSKPGIPDLLFIFRGKVFGLELKTPGRHPTAIQHETMNAMRAAGATVAVAHGIDEATAQLEAWKLLRPNRNTGRDACTDHGDDLRA
jgi:hypothetical protein